MGAAGASFLVLSAHSFLTYPLSLKLFARRLPPPVLTPADACRPSLAICVSAYNEQDVITGKIRKLLAMAEAYGPATIHVYADCPSDDTVRLLRHFGDRIDLVVGDVRRGKTLGMTLLAARSDSELLMFTDANVQSDVDAAIELVRPFADPMVGMTTAKLIYSNRRETATSALGAAYWAIEEAIKRIETHTVGLIGCDGAMFVMRRSLYRAPPPQLIDDLYLSLSILLQHRRVISIEQVAVFERSATGAGEEQRRKQRIACQAINVHRALWPGLRRLPRLTLYAYLSHRVLKWLMPFFLLGAAVSGAGVLAQLIGLVPAAALIGAGAAAVTVAGRFGLKPLSLVSSAILSLTGVGAGVIESLAGRKTYTVWEPVATVRDADRAM